MKKGEERDVSPKTLVSLTEITLAEEDQYMGDRIIPYCCENCGYEFYREMEKRKE